LPPPSWRIRYEFGSKGSFFDRKLAIEASVYLIDWTNIQTQVYLPSCGEAFTANRGKAVSQGFDLQMAAIPLAGLKLGLNIGYTNAYYANGSYGAPSGGVTPIRTSAASELNPEVGDYDLLQVTAGLRAHYRDEE
jgi:outer membrane receptor protein involved in Fe transport